MTWPIQDQADAFLALARTAPPSSPALTVYDGLVPKSPAASYALVYFSIETPDGVAEPDKISLTYASTAINARAYVHCVSIDASGARAVAGRIRAGVLDQVLAIAGRSCFPIRWREGQPPQRNEDVPGAPVFDLVDVYGWSSIPG
jgi:hypothetical protein